MNDRIFTDSVCRSRGGRSQWDYRCKDRKAQMNDDEKIERARQMIADEIRTKPRGLWYLSYADDESFRGGVYIEAYGPASAALRANIENLSPGGQVMIFGPLPTDKIPERKFWNRTLTKAELRQADPDEWKTLGELEAEKENDAKR
jgi:threonine dehydrogenase-like Zn-dependent dehydrogenase